jgi:valyl-tRNA synthetase
MLTDFPKGDAAMIDEQAERETQAVIELISKVRNIRAEMNIKPSDKPAIHVAADADLQKIFTANKAQILKLARADGLKLATVFDIPKASAKGVLTGGAEVALPLEGLIDFAKEAERLENQMAKLAVEGERLQKQLANQSFVEKAPAEKVREISERVSEIEAQTKILRQNIEALR